MWALYKGTLLLRARILEARGPNLILVNGCQIDQSGAVSTFERLLIPIRDLEPIEFEDAVEEGLFNEARAYIEPVLTREVPGVERNYKIFFRRPSLPKIARLVELGVYEFDPFTNALKPQRVMEVGEDFVVSRGVNRPHMLRATYDVSGRPFTMTLEVIRSEEAF